MHMSKGTVASLSIGLLLIWANSISLATSITPDKNILLYILIFKSFGVEIQWWEKALQTH